MTTPYIVAEISCNHLGSLGRALNLIDAAKYAGADAVKFQCWHRDRMSVDRNFIIDGGPWDGYTLPTLYAEAHTPWEWFPNLFDYAARAHIECFSSVFDIEALAFLESLHCPRYKIASFEITDLRLIEAVAKTGKPIAISAGMAEEIEIDVAVVTAQLNRNCPAVTVLKCTSAYPADAAGANLATMADIYGVYVGVSDHTLGLAVPVAATALGATMIEKHLTLARADGGPDAGFSSEPNEFKAMVEACREAAAAIGTVTYGPTEAERPSLIYRRSLYARKPLSAGEEITPLVFDACVQTSRPALGLPPSYPLIGRRMLRDVPAGRPITEADLES